MDSLTAANSPASFACAAMVTERAAAKRGRHVRGDKQLSRRFARHQFPGENIAETGGRGGESDHGWPVVERELPARVHLEKY